MAFTHCQLCKARPLTKKVTNCKPKDCVLKWSPATMLPHTFATAVASSLRLMPHDAQVYWPFGVRACKGANNLLFAPIQ